MIAAQRAVWRLARAPRQAVARIGGALLPADPAESREVRRLIHDLTSDQFPVRQKAVQELEKKYPTKPKR